MKNALVLALLLVGCGGEDVHEIVTCGAWASMPEIAGDKCERGCDLEPSNYGGTGDDMPCSASNPRVEGELRCARTFETDGQRGCCVEFLTDTERYSFAACD
jgi:hypothetical protein